MYAVLGGFYLVALGFRARQGIEGLLAGFISGESACAGRGDRAHGAVDDGPSSGKEEAPPVNAAGKV